MSNIFIESIRKILYQWNNKYTKIIAYGDDVVFLKKRKFVSRKTHEAYSNRVPSLY